MDRRLHGRQDAMGRRFDRAPVAQVGAIVFAWALLVPILAGAPAREEMLLVSDVVSTDVLPPVGIRMTPASSSLALLAPPLPEIPKLRPVAVLGQVSAASVAAPARAQPEAPPKPAAPAKPVGPPPESLVRDGEVIASWYGPGFYGNKTACGQTYTPEIIGVAHRILKCGTLITITSPRGVVLTVPVIDRGPFISGRALDLSNATKIALNCSDLCRVHMKVID